MYACNICKQVVMALKPIDCLLRQILEKINCQINDDNDDKKLQRICDQCEKDVRIKYNAQIQDEARAQMLEMQLENQKLRKMICLMKDSIRVPIEVSSSDEEDALEKCLKSKPIETATPSTLSAEEITQESIMSASDLLHQPEEAPPTPSIVICKKTYIIPDNAEAENACSSPFTEHDLRSRRQQIPQVLEHSKSPNKNLSAQSFSSNDFNPFECSVEINEGNDLVDSQNAEQQLENVIERAEYTDIESSSCYRGTLLEYYEKIGNDYVCKLCTHKTVKFQASSSIGRHVKIVHLGFKIKCTLCDKIFQYKYLVCNHYRKAHNTEPPAELKIVETSWHKSKDLAYRKIDNHFECLTCSPGNSANFEDQNSVVHHINTEHFDIRYKCEVCEMRFRSESGLELHLQKKHTEQNCQQFYEEITNSSDTMSVPEGFEIFEIDEGQSNENQDFVQPHDQELSLHTWHNESSSNALADFNDLEPQNNSSPAIEQQEESDQDDELLEETDQLLNADSIQNVQIPDSSKKRFNHSDCKQYFKRINNKFHCLLCSETYTRYGGVLHHLKSAHLAIRYQCTDCSANYTSYFIFTRHYRKHHPCKPVPSSWQTIKKSQQPANACKGRRNENRPLLQSYRKISGIYNCLLCPGDNGETYKTKNYSCIKYHFNRHHLNNAVEQNEGAEEDEINEAANDFQESCDDASQQFFADASNSDVLPTTYFIQQLNEPLLSEENDVASNSATAAEDFEIFQVTNGIVMQEKHLSEYVAAATDDSPAMVQQNLQTSIKAEPNEPPCITAESMCIPKLENLKLETNEYESTALLQHKADFPNKEFNIFKVANGIVIQQKQLKVYDDLVNDILDPETMILDGITLTNFTAALNNNEESKFSIDCQNSNEIPLATSNCEQQSANSNVENHQSTIISNAIAAIVSGKQIDLKQYYKLNANRYYCKLCNRKTQFVNKRGVEYHLRSHHFGIRYQCSECTVQYTEYRAFRKHFQAHHMHKRKIKIPTVEQVQICTTPLTDSSAYRKRTDYSLLYRKVGNQFICNLCGQKYNFSPNIRYHINHIHLKKKAANVRSNRKRWQFDEPTEDDGDTMAANTEALIEAEDQQHEENFAGASNSMLTDNLIEENPLNAESNITINGSFADVEDILPHPSNTSLCIETLHYSLNSEPCQLTSAKEQHKVSSMPSALLESAEEIRLVAESKVVIDENNISSKRSLQDNVIDEQSPSVAIKEEPKETEESTASLSAHAFKKQKVSTTQSPQTAADDIDGAVEEQPRSSLLLLVASEEFTALLPPNKTNKQTVGTMQSPQAAADDIDGALEEQPRNSLLLSTTQSAPVTDNSTDVAIKEEPNSSPSLLKATEESTAPLSANAFNKQKLSTTQSPQAAANEIDEQATDESTAFLSPDAFNKQKLSTPQLPQATANDYDEALEDQPRNSIALLKPTEKSIATSLPHAHKKLKVSTTQLPQVTLDDNDEALEEQSGSSTALPKAKVSTTQTPQVTVFLIDEIPISPSATLVPEDFERQRECSPLLVPVAEEFIEENQNSQQVALETMPDSVQAAEENDCEFISDTNSNRSPLLQLAEDPIDIAVVRSKSNSPLLMEITDDDDDDDCEFISQFNKNNDFTLVNVTTIADPKQTAKWPYTGSNTVQNRHHKNPTATPKPTFFKQCFDEINEQFHCKQCHKICKSMGNARHHMNAVHLGIRYVCTECPKEYITLRDFQKHYLRQHKLAETTPKTAASINENLLYYKKIGKNFVCNICSDNDGGKTFSTKFNISYHMEHSHSQLMHKTTQEPNADDITLEIDSSDGEQELQAARAVKQNSIECCTILDDSSNDSCIIVK